MSSVANEAKAKLHFVGHETFSARHGWLKKAYDSVVYDVSGAGKSIFTRQESIADLGVGRNMVASIGHWAAVCGVLDSDKRAPTDFGRFIFDDEEGVDPFLEDPASLWLLHWNIVKGLAPATTWHFAFNYFSAATFEKETLLRALVDFARDQDTKRLNANTLKRDVDCFINTYVMRRGRKGEISEDSLDCPFTELKLIRQTPTRGLYTFDIGEKVSLPDEVFCFSLMQYVAAHHDQTAVIGYDRVAFDPGSPGRCFKLSEAALINRLERCADITTGQLAWIDTSGVRQLHVKNVADLDPVSLLKNYYSDKDAFAEAAE